MQAFLLDLDISRTRLLSDTNAEGIVLRDPPLDVYDSLHAVTEIEARRDDVGRLR
jgi:hypothetical protein